MAEIKNIPVPTENGMKVEECESRGVCRVPHIIIYTLATEVNVYEDGRVFVNSVQITDTGGRPTERMREAFRLA